MAKLPGKISQEIWSFIRELGVEGIGKQVFPTHIKGLLEKNPRKDVVDVILRLKKTNPAAADILLKRLRNASEEGVPDLENNVVNALGDMLPRDANGKTIQTEADEKFVQVAGLSDEDFAATVDAMKHNPISQWFSLLGGKSGATIETATGFVAGFAKAIQETSPELNQELKRAADKLRKFRMKYLEQVNFKEEE